MIKLKFATQYEHDLSPYSEVGSRFVTTYVPVYDDKGIWHLEESGKRNLYEEIQCDKDSCDINLIVKRFASGETDVLSAKQGVFADLTEMPTSLADALNKMASAEVTFAQLPLDVKGKFNNSFTEFLASVGSDHFYESLGFKRVSDEKPDESEVKEDA